MSPQSRSCGAPHDPDSQHSVDSKARCCWLSGPPPIGVYWDFHMQKVLIVNHIDGSRKIPRIPTRVYSIIVKKYFYIKWR